MSGIESLQATARVASVSRPRGSHPVLVVEDSDEDFDTLLTAARLAGIQHEIQRALTGDDCLSLLRGTAGHARAQVALVLLDLNTPHGDGRYALEQIHADPQLNAIPLVVLSTSANPRDVDFCYGHGANAYHVKPVSHSEYLMVLQTLLTYWLGPVVLPTEQSLER
ncbi:MAG: response regulator [Candidatus Saccharibacteria bacterium]|nr:response regulator [Rhodoferax sp.]